MMRRGRGFGGPRREYYQALGGQLSRMIEPAILYLLASGAAAHGYDLAAAANQLGLSEMEIDPAAVYRCLRQLEMQGCAVSAWDTAGTGPARRVYQLTDAGWQRLDAWAHVITQRTQAMQQFVNQVDTLSKD